MAVSRITTRAPAGAGFPQYLDLLAKGQAGDDRIDSARTLAHVDPCAADFANVRRGRGGNRGFGCLRIRFGGGGGGQPGRALFKRNQHQGPARRAGFAKQRQTLTKAGADLLKPVSGPEIGAVGFRLRHGHVLRRIRRILDGPDDGAGNQRIGPDRLRSDRCRGGRGNDPWRRWLGRHRRAEIGASAQLVKSPAEKGETYQNITFHGAFPN